MARPIHRSARDERGGRIIQLCILRGCRLSWCISESEMAHDLSDKLQFQQIATATIKSGIITFADLI